MFSEFMFLRFTDILDSRFDNFIAHLQQYHGKNSKGRPCCIDHGENIHVVYKEIAKTFGGDLLIAITILVIRYKNSSKIFTLVFSRLFLALHLAYTYCLHFRYLLG